LDEHYDLVVLPVFCGDKQVTANFDRFQKLLSLARLHEKQRGSWRNKLDGKFTHLLFYKHQFELNAELAEAAGYSGEMPPLYCPQGDPNLYRHLKGRIGLFINTPQNTFQALPNRQWPMAHWKSLVKVLDAKNLVLVGGQSDLPNLQELSRQTGAPFEATATLLDFTALCRNLKALVTTDGGGMHAAATSGVPIVSLHGTSSPILLHPWIYPTGKCIAILAPNTCSPCQRSLRLQLCEQGITRMACMERIDPQAVSRIVAELDQLKPGTCLILKGNDLLTKQEYIRSWKRKILATSNFNFARAALRLHAPSKSRLDSPSRAADTPSAASS
jgi:ADP-heptose:LPS heptosyltransferase